MKPIISVVIPAFNEEKLLGLCLDGIRKQTLPETDYEVLVIDNKSTDNTARIAREAGVKVIPYTERQGFAVTKQYGANKASGDLIAFLDADSIPAKDWLEKIKKFFTNEKLMIIGGRAEYINGNAITKIIDMIYDIFCRINNIFGYTLLWGFNMAVRKSAFDAVGGFNLELTNAEDWDLSSRIYKKFRRGSAAYISDLKVATSPRKFSQVNASLKYAFNGTINYFSIYIFRKSKSYGSPVHIRQ